jgi:hypothetical protein
MMYVLRCPNENCVGHGQFKEVGKYQMKYNKTLKKMVPAFIFEPTKCEECGTIMEFEELPNEIPNFSVGTFKGLPDEKKKEVLHKRFKKGMERGGNDQVEIKKREAIGKMIGYDK